jgi:hypothetical protein
MIDWTVHVSDLLVAGSTVGGGAYIVVRAIKNHLTRLESHEDELTLHAIELVKRGWARPEDAMFKLKYGRRAEDHEPI